MDTIFSTAQRTKMQEFQRAPQISSARSRRIGAAFSRKELETRFRDIQSKAPVGHKVSAWFTMTGSYSGSVTEVWRVEGDPACRVQFEQLATIAARKLGSPCIQTHPRCVWWWPLMLTIVGGDFDLRIPFSSGFFHLSLHVTAGDREITESSRALLAALQLGLEAGFSNGKHGLEAANTMYR